MFSAVISQLESHGFNLGPFCVELVLQVLNSETGSTMLISFLVGVCLP